MPTCSSCSIILARTTSSSARPSSTAFWMYFCGECEWMWIAVELNQQKNGLSPLPTLSSHLSVWPSTSASKVSMRLRVSGPVFSIFCLPTRPNFGSSVASSTSVAQACSTPRGPIFLQVLGILLAGIVELLGLLFRVEVVEVAEPFVEAMHGRQELVAVAEVVLAELRRWRSPAT